MRKITALAGYILLATLTAHCMSIPAPLAPVDIQSQKGKPQAEREKTYQSSLIDTQGKGYKVGGVPVNAMQIETLFTAPYVGENTKSLKKSADNWGTAAAFPGFFAGLSTIGSTAGTIVLVGSSASSNKSPDWGIIGIAWGITAAWWVIYIPFAVASSNKLTAASESYNADLARALDLQQKMSANPVPLQERYQHHTVSWAYRY